MQKYSKCLIILNKQEPIRGLSPIFLEQGECSNQNKNEELYLANKTEQIYTICGDNTSCTITNKIRGHNF